MVPSSERYSSPDSDQKRKEQARAEPKALAPGNKSRASRVRNGRKPRPKAKERVGHNTLTPVLDQEHISAEVKDEGRNLEAELAANREMWPLNQV